MNKSSIWFGFILYCISIAYADAMTSSEAISRLKAGNDRFVRDALEHPNRSSDRREAVVSKQSPFAIVVSCSDSRVPPEILFDQGVGDLFVVRVAGNVIGALELDSIDYAAKHLGSVCVIVLGHENCGAVKAVLDGTTKDIPSVAKLIAPAVQEVKQGSPNSPNMLAEAVKENANRMRDFLVDSPVVKKLIKERKMGIYSAYYNLKTGAVEWL